MNKIKKQIKIVSAQMGEAERKTSARPDVFTIVLTSVGTELISFRIKTGKITDDEERMLTDAIVNRIMRKLKEYNLNSK